MSQNQYIGTGDGFFDPGGMYRRINQEAVVLLGGGYAILLQLAHPFITAGVDDHSNFQSEILERLYRTVLFEHQLIFENKHRGRKALKHFHDMHKGVRGYLGHRSGSFPAGTAYSGSDPQAKLWVHATFVDTSLKVYEKFIRPLSPEEYCKYYEESIFMAKLLGIPEGIVPDTYQRFREYMKDILSSNTLAVTDTTYRLARAVLHPEDVGFMPGLSARLLRFVTAGLLPDRFRKEYGLKWDRKRQRLLDGFSGSIRLLRPVTPSWVWQSPLLNGGLSRLVLWGTEDVQRHLDH